VRKWWVWVFASLLLTPALLSDPAGTIKGTAGVRAVLSHDYQIDVYVQPHDGDAWTRLAKRVTGDAARWEDIAQFNQSDDTLKTYKTVRVPFALLKPSLQVDIVSTIFPNDRRTANGWQHYVIGGRGIEGEPLWNIAEWFTGDGANYAAVRKAKDSFR